MCKGFNADFDGDQMAVHLPLSIEAQVEAHDADDVAPTTSSARPTAARSSRPSQDIVMGCYYLTADRGDEGETVEAGDGHDLLTARTRCSWPTPAGKVGVHARIKVRLPAHKKLKGEGREGVHPRHGHQDHRRPRDLQRHPPRRRCRSTTWRWARSSSSGIIADCYQILGRRETIELLDHMKDLGFRESTRSGLSFATDDLNTPPTKDAILDEAEKEVDKAAKLYQRGIITEQERYNKVLDAWTHAREQITAEMMEELRNDVRGTARSTSTRSS